MRNVISIKGHLIELERVRSLIPHYDPQTGKGSHYTVDMGDGEPFDIPWKDGYSLYKKLIKNKH